MVYPVQNPHERRERENENAICNSMVAIMYGLRIAPPMYGANFRLKSDGADGM